MPDDLEQRDTLLLEGPEEQSQWEGRWMGGGWGEPGWVPREVGPEPQVIEGQWEDVTEPVPKDKTREKMEKRVADYLRQKDEFEELERRTKIEELRARSRGYRRAYRPQVGKWIKTYLKPRPQTELAKIFFPGRFLRDTYIPSPPIKTTTEQIKELQRVTKPEMGLESSLGRAVTTELGGLKRAGSPPPTPKIKTPSRNPEEFEGVGHTLIRLRRLGEMNRVDQAVLAEVQGNGDIDTPSHVKMEVSRLGFSTKEIDTSLKRLRGLGLLIPSGRTAGGEKELTLSGGSHG